MKSNFGPKKLKEISKDSFSLVCFLDWGQCSDSALSSGFRLDCPGL